MTPETRECRSPPPSSSAVTTSPVAAFTSGGPPRKIVPWLRTITASSLIAGTYAPPAVHEPSTAAICGMPRAGHRRLVEEDPAEVLAVREDLVLPGQERAAGVDQVDARQAVVQRDLLGAQVLLDRHRVVRAALDGGVVGDDHALAAGHPADAGDDAGGRAPRRRTCRSRPAADSSRNGEPGSSRASTRSRGSSLPRSTCRCRARSGPPSRAVASRSRSSSTSAVCALTLRLVGSAVGSAAVRRTGASIFPPPVSDR